MKNIGNETLIHEIMNKFDFFQDFTDEEKSQMTSLKNNISSFEDGEKIICQGDIDFAIFLVMEGEAIVSKEEAPSIHFLELKEGDVFGELSLLGKRLRSANVVSKGGTKTLKMEGLFLDSMPPSIQNKFKDHFIKAFIKRIDWMNQRILSIKEELNDVYTLVNEPINWLDEKNESRHKQLSSQLQDLISTAQTLLSKQE
jgi:CRP-like cAMP-binding protein